MLASELIQDVRAGVDEDNVNDLSDIKIVAALNRALQRLARLSVRHYPELLKRTVPDQTVTTEITLPVLAQAFHQTQVDVKYGIVYRTLQYTSQANTVGLEAPTTYPLFYSQQGNKLYLYPPSTGVVARVRYELKPPKLVKEQGRITNVDTENGYVYLESIDSSLTTSVSNMSAFFNIVDQFTGDIKGTFQAAAIDTQARKVTIKTTGLGRTSVYGYDVATELPDTISQDDYICPASGSCIPLYFREYTDYLIQYAINDIKRKFNTIVETDIFALRDIEDDVKLMWSQRPYGARVRANNPAWNNSRLLRGRFLR